MTLQEAMLSRHSVRKYIDKPIEAKLIGILQEKVGEVNAEGNLHVQLITNEPKAFKGKMAYGVFKGVSNYFVMVGKKNQQEQEQDLSERVGYYGEQLVLLAETLGLNTCWVGITYNNIKDAYEKDVDEKVCCVIALGYGNDPGIKHKRKTIQQLSNAGDASSELHTGPTPNWFYKGMEAVRIAPTAINQQRFFFRYLGKDENGIHRVKAERKFSLFGYTRIDLGIAKLHFEIGAGKENFEWT